jgi:hypothetical protein
VVLRGRAGASVKITVQQSVEAEAASVVGPDGGTVTVTDHQSPLHGFALEFPPGALSADAVVSIRAADETLWTGLPAFVIESPEALQLPATIRYPLSDLDEDGIVDGTSLPVRSVRQGVRLYRQSDVEGAYELVPSLHDVANGGLVAETTRFSKWIAENSWSHDPGRWQQGVVYYEIDESIDHLAGDSTLLRREIHRAFDLWQQALAGHLEFREVPEGDGRTNIRLAARDLEPNDLQGQAGWLRSRQMQIIWMNSGPSLDGKPRHWLAGYDPWPSDDQQGALPWTPIPTLRIVAHEISHAIGLDFDRSACNWSTAPPAHLSSVDCRTSSPIPATALSPEDIRRVREHYGLATGLSGWGTSTTDGVLRPSEWKYADGYTFDVRLPSGAMTPATLRIMNDHANLYVGLSLDAPGVVTLSLFLGFDAAFDGFGAGDDAIQLRGDNRPNPSIALEDYVGIMVAGQVSGDHDDELGGTNDGGTALSWTNGRVELEGWHPLRSGDVYDFHLAGGGAVGLTILAVDVWDQSSNHEGTLHLDGTAGSVTIRVQ